MFHERLICLLDFYHLDYLQPESAEPPSTVFQHRAQDAQRQRPQKIDFSKIEDPLFAQAAACAPPTPSTPSNDEQNPFSQHQRNSTSNVAGSPRSTNDSKAKNVGRLAHDASNSSDHSEDESCLDEEEYETDDSHLLTHTRVYALAEKYDIPSLKGLAKCKFEEACACWYDSPEFADAIEEVYCSTIDSDRGLRDVVLQAFRSHPQLASTQDVFAVIKRTSALAFELWKVERGIPI